MVLFFLFLKFELFIRFFDVKLGINNKSALHAFLSTELAFLFGGDLYNSHSNGFQNYFFKKESNS